MLHILQKRNSLITTFVKYRYLYLMLFPGLLWFFIYRYLPMAGLLIAFKEFSFSKGILGSDWAGLKYFEFIFFRHPDFYRILTNTLLINFYRIVISMPVPIILALMLNEVTSSAFRRSVQTLIYLPHFVSWVIFGGIIVQFLSPSSGLINGILKSMGLEPVFFLIREDLFRSIIVVSDIWKSAGWGTIIYLAALSGVDPQLFDAATIDGANRWQKIIHITIPSISATIVIIFLLKIGQLLQIGFEQIYVLYNPAVYSTGDVISTYVYRVGIGQGRFSLTTAIGLFQSIIGLILISSANWFSRRYLDRSLW
ncbi:protein lplB [Marispirochaeta aestuarii]|uniref:Protein lplB n=2 Tax=Marispirochaeta aestuarii TaxID=1963862 RepID=A0A1Y1RVX0_9SPIO|nr:protein lplB [Marispirochaeta aestuarii]